MKRIFSSILCIAMLSALLAGCSQSGTQNNAGTSTDGASQSAGSMDEIKIGVVAPLSGNTALTGQYMQNGISLVEDLLDANGGLTLKDGTTVPVKFYYEDNEAKANITANCFNKLIDEIGVLGIVGPDSSTAMLAGAPIAQEAGCPAITTFGTNVKVTEVGDYIFRACFIDPFQGKVMAEYAYNTVGAQTAAVLFNNSNDFSVGLTDAFKENFEALGGAIVDSQSYSGSDVKDFNVQLTNIKGKEPDVLFAPGMLAELPLILQQAKNVGITCPILSGDAADTPELATMAGVDVVEGLTYTSAFSADSTEPTAVEFVNAYKEKFNEVPNSNAVLAYEGTMIMLEAIQNADSLDRSSVRDSMAQIDGLELPSGSISFDESRNPIKGAVILQFQEGEAKYITSITPE